MLEQTAEQCGVVEIEQMRGQYEQVFLDLAGGSGRGSLIEARKEKNEKTLFVVLDKTPVVYEEELPPNFQTFRWLFDPLSPLGNIIPFSGVDRVTACYTMGELITQLHSPRQTSDETANQFAQRKALWRKLFNSLFSSSASRTPETLEALVEGEVAFLAASAGSISSSSPRLQIDHETLALLEDDSVVNKIRRGYYFSDERCSRYKRFPDNQADMFAYVRLIMAAHHSLKVGGTLQIIEPETNILIARTIILRKPSLFDYQWRDDCVSLSRSFSQWSEKLPLSPYMISAVKIRD